MVRPHVEEMRHHVVDGQLEQLGKRMGTLQPKTKPLRVRPNVEEMRRQVVEGQLEQLDRRIRALQPKTMPHRVLDRAPRHSTLKERLGQMSPERVTMISAVTNVLLSTFKIGVGVLGGSTALVADGAHSFSDLLSDTVCWVAVQLAKRPADDSHPQGYAIYEHVGSAGIAAMLTATGVGMAVQSGAALMGTLQFGAAAGPTLQMAPLIVAVASVASKELLFQVTYQVGKHHDSPSTVANAYHHRSDALSSFVALVGILGALMGCTWLDPLAATAVGLMVARMGLEVGHDSVSALAEHMSSAGQGAKLRPA
jgi:cation diffusion facilitator family transporter